MKRIMWHCLNNCITQGLKYTCFGNKQSISTIVDNWEKDDGIVVKPLEAAVFIK